MSSDNGRSPSEPFGSWPTSGDGDLPHPGPSFVDSQSAGGQPSSPQYSAGPDHSPGGQYSSAPSYYGPQSHRNPETKSDQYPGQLPTQPERGDQRRQAPPNLTWAQPANPKHFPHQSSQGSKQPSALVTVLAIFLSLVLVGALVYGLNDSPSGPGRRSPTPTGTVPAAGPDYKIQTAPEHFLAADFRDGFMLREVDDMALLGYDPDSEMYVTRENRYTLFGRDAASGEVQWSMTSTYCMDASYGRIYCEKDSQVHRLDIRTGAIIPTYPKPAAYLIGDYLGVQDGLEYFIFGKPTIVAAGKDGAWVWQTTVAEEYFPKCALLGEKIGCSTEGKITILDAKTGAIATDIEVGDRFSGWLSDGYMTRRDGTRICDLNGNDLGEGHLNRIAPTDALYEIAATKRQDDAEVLDESGRIVVAKDQRWRDYFPNHKYAEPSLSWIASTPDGKFIAAHSYSTKELTFWDDSGNQIGRVENVNSYRFAQSLLMITKDDIRYLVVPKK